MPAANRNILVTGAAGFIGYHVSRQLLAQGDQVVGIDNLCDYYDVGLKNARIAELRKLPGFTFRRLDLSSREELSAFFQGRSDGAPSMRGSAFDGVVHLAAQVGVRYSVENPRAYIDSNLVGWANLLEAVAKLGPRHVVFASSSSVYGANSRLPYAVDDPVDHPLSLYAATKRAGELLAHSQAVIHNLPLTGLRFFTVYGPWGRPDMAMYLFTRAIIEGRPIDLFNEGRMQRDFTYVDDVAQAVVRVLDHPPRPDATWSADAATPAGSFAPFRLYNVGNHQPVELLRLVGLLEECLGIKAQRNLLPAQPGDLPATCADTSDLLRDFGFQPTISIEEGVRRFVEWYRAYYGVPR